MTKLKTPPALKMTYEVTDEAKMEAYRAAINRDNNKKRRERSLAILERQYKKYLAAKEQAETKKALIHDAERFINDIIAYCMDGDDRWRFDAIKKKMEELITPDARKERIKETESRLRILYPDAFEAEIKYDPEIREASKKAWDFIEEN